MMAKGDSVTKNKKSNSYKPYDANNSLIKRVTSRVSQYLPRPSSWIQSFLTPSDQSAQSSSFPTTDEDGHRPAKRLRTAQTNTDFGQDPPSVSLNLDSRREEEISPIRNVGTCARPDFAVAGPSGLQRKHFIASTPAVVSETQPPLIPKINGDDVSDSESASSSSAPMFGRAHGVKFSHLPLHTRTAPSLSKGPTPGSSKQARIEPNTSLRIKEQYSFDSTVFFSPFKGRLCGSELSPSLLNCSHDSSFYKGNTTFGGASSCTDSLFRTKTLPSETPVIVKPTETVKQSSNLATSTTRILKALEQFSSPVIDARKMAPGRTSISRRAAPFRELVVPKMPDLLRIKRRDARQLRAASAAARSAAVAASLSSTSPAQAAATLSSDGSPSLSFNTSHPSQMLSVQARLGSGEPCSSKDLLSTKKSEPSEKTPSSPASFGFEKPKTALFSTLPKFDPGIVKLLSPLSEEKVKSDNSAADKSKAFTFSKPIAVTQEAPPPSPVSSSWKFRKPINPEESSKPDSLNKSHQNCSLSSTQSTMMYSPPSEIVLKRKQPSKPKPPLPNIFSSIIPPKTSDNIKPVTTSTSSELLNKLTNKKWECRSCYVQNNESLTKCASCEQPRNAEKSPVASTTEKKTDLVEDKKCNNPSSSNPFTGFGDKFKMSKDQWECSGCLVRNDVSKSECASCGQVREKNAAKSSPNEGKTQFSFGVESKTSDKWECQDCYVQNKASELSCVSCSSKRNKPATNVQSNSLPVPAPATSAPSNPPLSSLFKKPEGMWECDSCLVQNKPDVSVCIACGGRNPKAKAAEVKPAPSSFSCGFSFGVPPEERLAASSESKPAFSFGVKPASTSAPVSFGVPSAPSVASTVPSTAVPSFSFGQSSTAAPTSTFSFGIPPNSEEKTEKPSETNPPNNIFGQPTKTVAKSDETLSNSWNKKKENVPNFSAPVPMSPDPPPDQKVSPFGAPLNNNDPPTSKPTPFTFGSSKPLAVTTASSTPSLGMSKPVMNATSFVSTTSTTPAPAYVFSFNSKPEPTVNSLEKTSTVAPSQEVKNIFGSVMNKPQPFGTDSPKTESTVQSEDKSKLFVFGSSDKTTSLNCNAVKPGGFSFSTSKVEEPKLNAVNSEPAKSGFASPSPFTSQPNAFSGGFGSTTTTTSNSGNKGFSFGGSGVGGGFQAPSPFSFGPAKPAEQQPLVNHSNNINASAPTPQFGSTSTFGARQTNETPAPGFGSTTQASTGGFTFSTQQNTSSPFSFSAPQGTGNSATPQAATGFSFGATQQQATTQAPAFDSNTKTTFNFSSPQSSAFASKPAIGGSGGFNFKPTEASPAFSFGAKPTEQPMANHTNNLGSAPQFGSSSSAFSSQPAGNMFTSPATGGFGTTSTPQTAQVFSFSAPQQNNASPFSFTTSQVGSNRPTTPAGSGFTFGASQPTGGGAPPSFDPNAKPSFNFSSGQQPTFSAGTPGDGMLPIASDSTAKAGRKIRKAVRRTVPK